MSVQKPTVGRIVHFYTKSKTQHHNGQGEGPYPAIVIQVFNQGPTGNPNYDTMANLKVLHWGGTYDEGSVCEKSQAEANGDKNRWWVWPPRE